jgi:stage V sporulation protein G
MEITDVKVFPVEEERLKAYVTIIIDNCFLVREIKVINGNSGYFVAMPSKKRKDGTYRDLAHPINQDTRDRLEKVIMDAYWKRMEEIKKEPAGEVKQEKGENSEPEPELAH